MIKVSQALEFARNAFNASQIPFREAWILLEHATQHSKIDFFSGKKNTLFQKEWNLFQDYIQRRTNNEPLSYITGKRFFYKNCLKVNSKTFIPRPETELLVDEALSFLSKRKNENLIQMLEFGLGSGAISIAVAGEIPGVFIDAVDISSEALLVAKENIENHQLHHRIKSYCGDLYEALPQRKSYDLIVSNPPYIPRCRMDLLQKEVLAEPLLALDGGHKGLECIFNILHQAPWWIKKGGLLLLEIDGEEQVSPITSMLHLKSFHQVFCRNDLSGKPRIMGGYKS